MANAIIKKTIKINSSSKNLWRVFTDPILTRQMGGEYVSDWKVNGTFGWKANNGPMLTNGIILELVPEKLLKHSLLDLHDSKILLSEITYELKKEKNGTLLSTEEKLNYRTTPEQLKTISEGWDFALQFLKEIAEKI